MQWKGKRIKNETAPIMNNKLNNKEKYSQFPVHHFSVWCTPPDLKGAAEKTNMVTKIILLPDTMHCTMSQYVVYCLSKLS